MDHLKHDLPLAQKVFQAFGQHVPQLTDLEEQIGQAVHVFAGCALATLILAGGRGTPPKIWRVAHNSISRQPAEFSGEFMIRSECIEVAMRVRW